VTVPTTPTQIIDLSGRVAIITGAANGMGRVTAELFVSLGAKVTLTDIDSDTGTKAADALGDDAIFIPLDVSDPEAWNRVVEKTTHTFGPPTVLVNNAGIFGQQELLNIAPEEFFRHIKINLYGPFLGTQAVLPSMKKTRKGSIVNISSVSGIGGFADQTPYAVSKWGVRGLTKTTARDLGKYGVRVNCILPGLIDTDMARINTPETIAAYIDSLPVGQIGAPEDVARMSAFLASDAACFVTGTDIVVDGGQTV